jgi:hypothetical protein
MERRSLALLRMRMIHETEGFLVENLATTCSLPVRRMASTSASPPRLNGLRIGRTSLRTRENDHRLPPPSVL